ncbi:MAG: class I SAM-dependent methyltransferase [Candidatus Aenigmarchaeota archaeon]|nr:class I SAM-dependent methyltransferase [Candidatus Aenigmarchaeota archaeon]
MISMFFSKIYESWKETQRSKYESLWRALGKDFFAAFQSSRVLDLGCGSGYFESFLQSKGVNAPVIGADIEFTQKVRPFVLADGSELPFRDGIFDVVVCIDTVHLLQGSDFRRVLRDRGLALFSVFFNESNFEQRVAMLKGRLNGFEILLEFEAGFREKDYVIIAKKE